MGNFFAKCPWKNSLPIHNHEPLTRDELGEIILNNRCRLFQVVSHRLDMEETGGRYDRWRQELFPGAGGERASGWDEGIGTAFKYKTLAQKVSEDLPRLWELIPKPGIKPQYDGTEVVSRVHDQDRDRYVAMVENHLLAPIRGNVRWDFPVMQVADVPNPPYWSTVTAFPRRRFFFLAVLVSIVTTSNLLPQFS